ncbi:hypothetical protein CTAYLR_004963 [Chrysophaeum taylorii]|uniref:Uncharacterized protein n=1 Tax=Chrysophaeum taylorii TaxID=2483200 RepID=A0AAD7UR53_9STRA|nr:hypothetical protein CTAYLR_004963 [Chrysophaeum taylorii]
MRLVEAIWSLADVLSPKSVAVMIHDALLPLDIHVHKALTRGIIECVYYLVIGVGLGMRSFYAYATRDGMKYRGKSSEELGYPEIAGFATGISVLGGALSFLLVFRLSWSFSTWYEARGLIGQSMARLRALAVMMVSNYGRTRRHREFLDTCKAVFKLHASSVARELCFDNQEITANAAHHAVLADQHLGRLGLGRARMFRTSKHRVLACHSWLQQCVNDALDKGLLTHNEHLVAHDHITHLLEGYYALMKIKTTTAPPAIHLLVFVLKTSYCLLLYPQFLAYAFMMKLDETQRLAHALWRTSYFPAFFATLATLGILYFVALHLIALELDDPFGDDISDFPLLRWSENLWLELDDIFAFYDDDDDDGGGGGGGAGGLPKPELLPQTIHPSVVPLAGGSSDVFIPILARPDAARPSWTP